MSAPDTNIETQKKRHRPALLGMNLAVLFALALLIVFLAYLFFNGGTPGEEAATALGAVSAMVA